MARTLFGLIAASAALTASAALAAEGSSGGMPQLEPSGFAPQLVWLVITFAVLYLVMARVALPRIAEVLEERQTRISHDLDEAERLKKETEKAIADYEAALGQARAQAQAVAGATRARVGAEAGKAKAELDARLADEGKAAEARILAARDQAIAGIGAAAEDITRAVVRQLLGTEADANAVRAAVQAAAKGGR